jgi:hypothetical protein
MRLLVITATSLAFAGCMSLDDEPQQESDVESAIATYHRIVNEKYNQFVNAPNGALNVTLNLARQPAYWYLDADGLDQLGRQKYLLRNLFSGYCAEVNDNSTAPGARVDEWICDGSQQSEQWVKIEHSVNGFSYDYLQHANTDQCLDTVGGADSNLMQYTCDSPNDPQINAQTWDILNN